MFKKFVVALAALLAAAAFAAVDANKANQADLEAIKGIGPVISTLIINERKKGDFKDWNDMVVRVKGVGEKNAAKMSDGGLTVNGATYTGAPAPAMTKTTAKTADRTAEKAPMTERAASTTKAVASKAASAVKTGAEKAASATKGAGKVVKEDAKEQKDAVKENVQDAKAKRAEKKAEKAAAASAAK